MSKQHVTRSRAHKAGGRAVTEPCACCGIAPDPDGKPLSVTFENPDVIFDIAPELLDTWGGDPFLAIKDVGFFVRVLLPVALTDGFAVEFGTWLEVDAEDFRLAWQTWNFPEYADLVLEGYVANQIAPWRRFHHGLAQAVVTDRARVPILTTGTNEEINEVLGKTWPHAEVLAPYVDLLRADAPPPVEEP
jgi:hypothetical protein